MASLSVASAAPRALTAATAAHLALWAAMIAGMFEPMLALPSICAYLGVAAVAAPGSRRGNERWQHVLTDAVAMAAVATLALVAGGAGHHGRAALDLGPLFGAAVVVIWLACRMAIGRSGSAPLRAWIRLAPMAAMLVVMSAHGH